MTAAAADLALVAPERDAGPVGPGPSRGGRALLVLGVVVGAAAIAQVA